ncbi:MAG: hypothetical protein K9J37_16435 [Saprospiraceae bacterium]|nr:hypothetical protein [Saprospiraceae bacterium]MCF8251502.1 hypothetical protein [Saprospiraceae bacterium]MCF8280753.1 hypothetical protein [Bacteroidales bacterium]MCF8313362.1 hypothetical protein [Saprospiraceae bacterium]MCF8441818.1 hypothetical protein [Saprospiraceae bacterium]
MGSQSVDIYGSVNRVMLKTGVKGEVIFDIAGDSARLLVYAPAGSKYSDSNGVLMASGLPVDFRCGK